MYARFHDVIHTLQRMDDPPWEYTIVPLRRYYGKPSPNVLFQNGSAVFRLMNYLRNVSRASREADIVHVVQGDFPYSLLVPLVVKRGIPLVAGPNVTSGADLEHTARVSRRFRNRRKEAVHRLRLAKPYQNRLVFDRRSPASCFYKRVFVFVGYRPFAVAAGGMAEKKIEVLPSGVRTDIFSPVGERVTRKTEYLILYVGDGRRVYLKGYDVFLKALEYMKRKNVSFHAIEIGKRTPKSEQVRRKFSLERDIETAGFIARGSLSPFYRGADVFVCSSRHETDGTTSTEALACGTPVIRTERIGLTGISKLLAFEMGNAKQLCERLIEVHRNKEQYTTLARQESSQWDIEFVIRKLHKTYREVLSE